MLGLHGGVTTNIMEDIFENEVLIQIAQRENMTMPSFQNFKSTIAPVLPPISDDDFGWLYLRSAGTPDLAVWIFNESPSATLPLPISWAPPASAAQADAYAEGDPRPLPKVGSRPSAPPAAPPAAPPPPPPASGPAQVLTRRTTRTTRATASTPASAAPSAPAPAPARRATRGQATTGAARPAPTPTPAPAGPLMIGGVVLNVDSSSARWQPPHYDGVTVTADDVYQHRGGMGAPRWEGFQGSDSGSGSSDDGYMDTSLFESSDGGERPELEHQIQTRPTITSRPGHLCRPIPLQETMAKLLAAPPAPLAAYPPPVAAAAGHNPNWLVDAVDALTAAPPPPPLVLARVLGRTPAGQSDQRRKAFLSALELSLMQIETAADGYVGELAAGAAAAGLATGGCRREELVALLETAPEDVPLPPWSVSMEPVLRDLHPLLPRDIWARLAVLPPAASGHALAAAWRAAVDPPHATAPLYWPPLHVASPDERAAKAVAVTRNSELGPGSSATPSFPAKTLTAQLRLEPDRDAPPLEFLGYANVPLPVRWFCRGLGVGRQRVTLAGKIEGECKPQSEESMMSIQVVLMNALQIAANGHGCDALAGQLGRSRNAVPVLDALDLLMGLSRNDHQSWSTSLIGINTPGDGDNKQIVNSMQYSQVMMACLMGAMHTRSGLSDQLHLGQPVFETTVYTDHSVTAACRVSTRAPVEVAATNMCVPVFFDPSQSITIPSNVLSLLTTLPVAPPAVPAPAPVALSTHGVLVPGAEQLLANTSQYLVDLHTLGISCSNDNTKCVVPTCNTSDDGATTYPVPSKIIRHRPADINYDLANITGPCYFTFRNPVQSHTPPSRGTVLTALSTELLSANLFPDADLPNLTLHRNNQSFSAFALPRNHRCQPGAPARADTRAANCMLYGFIAACCVGDEALSWTNDQLTQHATAACADFCVSIELARRAHQTRPILSQPLIMSPALMPAGGFDHDLTSVAISDSMRFAPFLAAMAPNELLPLSAELGRGVAAGTLVSEIAESGLGPIGQPAPQNVDDNVTLFTTMVAPEVSADQRLFPHQQTTVARMLMREWCSTPVADGMAPVPLGDTAYADLMSDEPLKVAWTPGRTHVATSPFRAFYTLCADEMGLGKTISAITLIQKSLTVDLVSAITAAGLSRIMFRGWSGLAFVLPPDHTSNLTAVSPLPEVQCDVNAALAAVDTTLRARLDLCLEVINSAQFVTAEWVITELLDVLCSLGCGALLFTPWLSALSRWSGIPLPANAGLFNEQAADTRIVPSWWPHNLPCLVTKTNWADGTVHPFYVGPPQDYWHYEPNGAQKQYSANHANFAGNLTDEIDRISRHDEHLMRDELKLPPAALLPLPLADWSNPELNQRGRIPSFASTPTSTNTSHTSGLHGMNHLRDLALPSTGKGVPKWLKYYIGDRQVGITDGTPPDVAEVDRQFRSGAYENVAGISGSVPLGRREFFFSRATLVVCTATAVGQWRQELKRFAPNLVILEISSTNAKKYSIEAMCSANIILASHANVSSPQPYFQTIYWRRVIIDEFQLCHTYIPGANHLYLSGTPPRNLFSQMSSAATPRHILPHAFTTTQWRAYVSPFVDQAMQRAINTTSDTHHSLPYVVAHRKAFIPVQLPRRTINVYREQLTQDQQIVSNWMCSCLRPLVHTHGAQLMVRQHLPHLFAIAASPSLVLPTALISFAGLIEAASSRVTVQVRPKGPTKFTEKVTVDELLDLIYKHRDAENKLGPRDQTLARINEMLQGECAMCYEELLTMEHDPVIFGCTHIFCHACISQYLLQGISADKKCPFCRSVINFTNGYILQRQQREDDTSAAVSANGAAPRAPTPPPLPPSQASLAPSQADVPEEVAMLLDAGVPEDVAAAYGRLRLEPDPRIVAVVSCAESVISQGDERVLIVSRFKSVCTRIAQELTSRFGTGVVLGLTSETSRVTRTRVLDAFADPTSSARVLVATTRSVSSSVTLTSASHIILVEPAPNSRHERQVVDRVHRIGQTRPVVVHRFIANQSIESRIVERWATENIDISSFEGTLTTAPTIDDLREVVDDVPATEMVPTPSRARMELFQKYNEMLTRRLAAAGEDDREQPTRGRRGSDANQNELSNAVLSSLLAPFISSN